MNVRWCRIRREFCSAAECDVFGCLVMRAETEGPLAFPRLSSRRDMFAAHALLGITIAHGLGNRETLAQAAVETADALIKALDKRS